MMNPKEVSKARRANREMLPVGEVVKDLNGLVQRVRGINGRPNDATVHTPGGGNPLKPKGYASTGKQ